MACRKKSSVLAELVCPVCYEYMHPPILSCESGHGICELCHELLSECPMCGSNLTDIRNANLEALVTRVLVPCKSCKHLFRMDEIMRHECLPDTTVSLCILGQVYGECGWQGPTSDLLEHCHENHSHNCWTEMENIVKWKQCDISPIGGIQNVYLLDLAEVTFAIVQKYDSHAHVLQWYASYQGDQELCRFSYEIQIFSDTRPDTLQYKANVQNGTGIFTFLPDANEITICVDEVTHFLSEDRSLTYKVIVHKLSDVHLNMNGEAKKISSCTRKMWNATLYTYNSLKNCFR